MLFSGELSASLSYRSICMKWGLCEAECLLNFHSFKILDYLCHSFWVQWTIGEKTQENLFKKMNFICNSLTSRKITFRCHKQFSQTAFDTFFLTVWDQGQLLSITCFCLWAFEPSQFHTNILYHTQLGREKKWPLLSFLLYNHFLFYYIYHCQNIGILVHWEIVDMK